MTKDLDDLPLVRKLREPFTSFHEAFGHKPQRRASGTSLDELIARAVEAMREDPYMDDIRALGTTAQDNRMTHYATIAFAALESRPAATEGRDWARAIAETMDEGDGFWRACSGCQESVDGCVSTADYPYCEIFRCQPGSGCGECGGLGVIWDEIDYEAMARDDTTPSQDATEDQRFQAAITASNSFNNWPARDFRLNPLQETEREYWRPIAAAFGSPSRDEEGSVAVPIETLRDWYTQMFALFVEQTPEGDEDDRLTPPAMVEMEALLPPAFKTSTPETQTVEGGREHWSRQEIVKTIIHAMVDANGKVQAVPAGKAADHILAYLAPVLKSTTEESAPIYEEAALLDALRENSWDLRCFDRPTGGGDADIGWRIVGHWQAEPHERTIAEVYADDPRAAILAALSASTGARAC